MKVVFVCDTMNSGGAERVISTLSNEFVKHDYEVSILMMGTDATNSFYELNDSIKLISLFENVSGKRRFFAKAKLLRKTLESLKPDVVISFLSYVCIYTWWALRKTNIQYIVSERNDPNHRGKIKQFLLNRSFKKASACVFQTEDALKWYKRVTDKGTIIPNPVNLTFQPTDEVLKRKKQILYVGRFTEQKNVKLLINAFSNFKKTHGHYSLKMYGDGPLKQSLMSYVEEKGLKNSIVILPSSKTWQKDNYDSALFVLPSNFEGMPNVLMEALCLGMPAVSTDCTIGGPKELKKHFPYRLLLCKPNDEKDLCQKMENALLIKNEKAFIPEELTVDNVTNKWMRLIEKIVK